MKECKYCKSEIKDDAVVCPKCRKSQVSRGFPSWIITVGVVLLLVVAIVVGTSGGSTKDYSVGETGIAKGVEYTVVKAEESTTVDFEDNNGLVKEDPLEDGYKYLNVTIRLKNTNDTKINYSRSNFILLDGQANVLEQKSFIYEDDIHLSSGELEPNASIERDAVWKVKDGTTGLRVRYVEGLTYNTSDYVLQWSLRK